MVSQFAHHQRGMTFWTLVVVLALIGFFVKTAITVYPIIYNQYKVKAHLAQMAADPETPKLEPKVIAQNLMKRFGQIDNVEGITDKDIKVTRDEKTKKTTIAIDYEMRGQFFGPIYVVGDYRDTKIEVPGR